MSQGKWGWGKDGPQGKGGLGEGMGLKRGCKLGRRCVPKDGRNGVEKKTFFNEKMFLEEKVGLRKGWGQG